MDYRLIGYGSAAFLHGLGSLSIFPSRWTDLYAKWSQEEESLESIARAVLVLFCSTVASVLITARLASRAYERIEMLLPERSLQKVIDNFFSGKTLCPNDNLFKRRKVSVEDPYTCKSNCKYACLFGALVSTQLFSLAMLSYSIVFTGIVLKKESEEFGRENDFKSFARVAFLVYACAGSWFIFKRLNLQQKYLSLQHIQLIERFRDQDPSGRAREMDSFKRMWDVNLMLWKASKATGDIQENRWNNERDQIYHQWARYARTDEEKKVVSDGILRALSDGVPVEAFWIQKTA
jgi:hypothetical protein